MTNTAAETFTLTLTRAQIEILESELQHAAVFHLQSTREDESNLAVLNSDYYRANREVFGLVYDANPANR